MAYQSEIEKLQKQWEANPGQHFAPYAEALRKGGDIELAIDVVRAGLEKRPNYLSAHIVLGRCLVDLKKDSEATKAFEQVLVMDAENIIALRFLAEITERAGDTAGAQRWVKRLLDVDPMNDDAIEALKRLEAATPAEPPAEVVPAAAEPPPPVAAVSGFEATAMETAPAAAASDDFKLEQSTSTFESEADATPAPALDLESSDVSLEEGSNRGAKLDLEPSESGVVNLDAPGPAQPALAAAPDSFEPPMLSFDESSQAVAKSPEPAPAAPEPAAPQRPSGRRSGPALTPAHDLPLIMPDELEPAPSPPPARAPLGEAGEPEPVITETMAEVYVKQGLVSEAREVYRKLVERRPDDTALRERLASLERRVTPPRGVPAAAAPAPPAAGAPARPKFAAADTGGDSARSLFGQVLSSRPGSKPPPPSPASRSAMDAAFAAEPVQATGAPTRPTSDELSLAAVFGEEPTATPPTNSGAPPPSAPAGAGGFSFDEFFGAKKPPADAPPPAGGETPPPDAEGASPDDFVSWLKGLKS